MTINRHNKSFLKQMFRNFFSKCKNLNWKLHVYDPDTLCLLGGAIGGTIGFGVALDNTWESHTLHLQAHQKYTLLKKNSKTNSEIIWDEPSFCYDECLLQLIVYPIMGGMFGGVCTFLLTPMFLVTGLTIPILVPTAITGGFYLREQLAKSKHDEE